MSGPPPSPAPHFLRSKLLVCGYMVELALRVSTFEYMSAPLRIGRMLHNICISAVAMSLR